MSHFDNYSSEEGSTGEIEFPKTPGQPQREENDGEHDHHRVDNDSDEDEDDDGSSSSSAGSEAESNADSNIGDNDHNKSSDRDNDSEDNDDHASDREVEAEAAEGSDKEQNNEEEMSLDVNTGEATNNAKDDAAAEVEGNASQSNNANQNNVDDDSDSEDDDEAMRRLMMHRPQEMDMEMNMADQEEEEEERPEVTRIEAEAPRMKINFKQEDFKSVDYVKLPNFLSIDTHPFDPKTYEDEACDDDRQDDEGRARLKLKVENTIRWRRILDEDGNEVDRESNARIVKWSDGTCSLYLGDEIFHMTKHSQTGDNNHLFIRDQAGWSAQTIFKNKLTFRPSSTDSVTHRKLTLSLADRSQKTQKICVLPSVGIDPDAHRSEMIKKEEDRLKASIRKENQTRRLKERVYTRTGINSSFLEDNDEDDEGSFSISKIKNQYKSGGGAGNSQSAVYSSSDSDSSDDDFKGKRHR